jgi:Eukaryotic aspartyl protease
MRLLVLVVLSGCGDQAGIPPDAAQADASLVGPHYIPLTGCGYTYTGNFGIGDSVFRLSVDTGSNALGVAATGCTSCTAAQAPLYAPGTSAIDQHVVGSAHYDSGQIGWSGEIYTDAVSAGTLPAVRLALTAITTQQQFFFSDQCGSPQGILGLDAQPESGLATNFLHELVASGVTDEFAIHYCGANSGLWLGGYDSATTTASPMWTAMTQTNVYSVGLADIAVDGSSIASPLGQALVDSGGPNLLVPPAAFAALTAKIAASPAFQSKFGDATWFTPTSACKTLTETRSELDSELPTLTVMLGDPTISIVLPATAAYLQVYQGTTYCPALFSSSGIDLGNTLMRAGLVIHDREHGQLGFAPTPPCVE